MQMWPPLLSAAVAVEDCATGALRKLKRRRTHITPGLVQVTVMDAAKGTLLADPRLLVFLAANKGEPPSREHPCTHAHTYTRTNARIHTRARSALILCR